MPGKAANLRNDRWKIGTGRTRVNAKMRLVGKGSGSFSIVDNPSPPPQPISDFTHSMKLKIMNDGVFLLEGACGELKLSRGEVAELGNLPANDRPQGDDTKPNRPTDVLVAGTQDVSAVNVRFQCREKKHSFVLSLGLAEALYERLALKLTQTKTLSNERRNP
jgi:hypothetical protein